MTTHTGSCLCGEITYTFTGEIDDYGFCHCSMCRKPSGSAFSANAGVDEATFEIQDLHGYLKEYTVPGTRRFFCANCGSPLFSRIDKTPGKIRIRLGTLDTAFERKPTRHTHVASKAPWYEICDGLPQYDEGIH